MAGSALKFTPLPNFKACSCFSNGIFKLDGQENMASNETDPAGIIGGTGDVPTDEAGKIVLSKINYFDRMAGLGSWHRDCSEYVFGMSMLKATKLSAATDREQTGFTGLGERNLSYVLDLYTLTNCS
jgi:hypothetical protein